MFGFPGRTNEYLPAVSIEQITQKINPSNIEIRDASLKIIDDYMKNDDQIRIQYASKQARIANSWKRWTGENLGIEKSDVIQKKRDFEAVFNAEVKKQGFENEYGSILSDFDKLYADIESVAIKRSNFSEVFYTNNELMKTLLKVYQMELRGAKSEESFENARANLVQSLATFYKNYNATVDKKVYEATMPLYTTNVDASIYDKTGFTSLKAATKLLNGNSKQVAKKLSKDVAYQYAKPFIEEYYKTIGPKYNQLKTEIAAVQKKYMKALMQVMPDERYYPDANNTLRITYGQVKGYAPKDAVYYTPVTYLDGVVEKYIPGDYEFDIPEKLLDLYREKNYGIYADANGKLPVCFIGTNHTTGGNSGSPAIDAHGNLVGLNFDRVWEGTMSDMNYDPDICRNIMVDVRYVLFIIDKYAGASHLIDEMTLVHPKAKSENETNSELELQTN